jgi:glycosyltransferase involved in cell wall biosynthesis
MKKILIVDNSQGITGAFKSIFHVATSLKDQFEFHFATPKGNQQLAAEIKRSGFAHKQINFVEISKRWSVILYPPALLFNSLRLFWYMKRHDIPVIHVNDLYNMTGAVIKLLYPSVKVIYHVRLRSNSYAGGLYSLWLKIIARLADKIIVVSECVRKEVLPFTGNKKVIRIYDFFELGGECPPAHPDNHMVKFFYPANFTPGKGHTYAIESFRKAIFQNKSIRLTFAGDDFGMHRNKMYKMKLQTEAGDLVQGGYITFAGAVTDMEKAINEQDVVLNFSDSESFSMTCYEANHYGVPVIVTDCGGPTEFVEHEITGLIVPKQDVEAMSRAMLYLAESSDTRTAMGQQARDLIHKKIAEENALLKYAATYEFLFDQLV